MFARRLWTNLDWRLLLSVLGVATVGLWLLASTTWTRPGSDLLLRQFIWCGVGLSALVVILLVDYHSWATLAPLIYSVCLILLLLPIWSGRAIGGAKRWVEIGPVNVQPSEAMKIAVVLLLATFLARKKRYVLRLGEILVLVGIVALPATIIVLQPDLGTAIVLCTPLAGMIFVGGLRLRTLVGLGLILLLLLPVAWFTLLQDYQRQRVISFLDGEQDPQGASYQLQQSLIAVGSGGLVGKRPWYRTQSHLQFLPEEHTDFIIAVLAEQWGFLGSFVILSLYLVIFRRCVAVARMARDRLGVYLVIGVLSYISFQVFLNVGVVVGLLPTTGIALPMMSYGGSSLVTSLVAVGLVLNVGARRFVN